MNERKLVELIEIKKKENTNYSTMLQVWIERKYFSGFNPILNVLKNIFIVMTGYCITHHLKLQINKLEERMIKRSQYNQNVYEDILMQGFWKIVVVRQLYYHRIYSIKQKPAKKFMWQWIMFCNLKRRWLMVCFSFI